MLLNRKILPFLLFWFSLINIEAQVLRGRLIDNINQNGIANALITDLATNIQTTTNESGEFEFQSAALGDLIQLSVFQQAYHKFDITLLKADWNPENQIFYLLKDSPVEEVAPEFFELDSEDESQVGEVYSLLSSSDDPLKRVAGFELSSFRYKLRGVQNEFDQLGFNGFLLNDLESGRIPFQIFSGQSLITRYSEDYLSYKDNAFDFGSAGIGQWITSYPITTRKDFSFNYALTNRSYDHRLGFHYSSGLFKNNRALVFGINRRWAQEAFIAGSYYDAWGTYLGLTQAFDNGNKLNFYAVISPVKRGKASPGVQEVFDLSGDPYYNSYWGTLNGERRNSREANTFSPALFINYEAFLNKNLSFETGGMALYSRRSDQQLEWSNAPDPRPDYYQKLPSHVDDSAVAAIITDEWKTNEKIRQINWDAIYQANYNNYEKINNANGISGNIIEGNRAVYWLGKRFNNILDLEHFTTFKIKRERSIIALSYRIEHAQNEHYLEVENLLGADFVLDVEDFIDDPDLQHPDINRENKIIGEGEKYGYHYFSNNTSFSLRAEFEHIGRKLDFNIAGQFKNNRFDREGKFLNGIFNNSLGESESFGQSAYSLKGLLTYKINGRNYIQANLAHQQLPLRFDQLMINPEWRADLLNTSEKTQISLGDIAYYYRSPSFKFRFAAYGIVTRDQTINKNFFLDEQLENASAPELADGSLINAFYTNLDSRNIGLELSAEYRLPLGFEITAVFMNGDHIYTSRPELLIFDKFSHSSSEHTVYLKNFYVYGTPQQAAHVGLKYNFRKSGFVILSTNALDRYYIEPNPLRRIPEAVRDIDPGSPQFTSIISQEKLPSAFYLNLFMYKPLNWFGQKWFLAFSINNLLNTKDLRSGGFEQFRFDYETKDPSVFPSKYYYLQGINYYLSLTWRI